MPTFCFAKSGLTEDEPAMYTRIDLTHRNIKLIEWNVFNFIKILFLYVYILHTNKEKEELNFQKVKDL